MIRHPSVRTNLPALAGSILLSLLGTVAMSSVVGAVEPVSAVMEQREAWVGEPVLIVVTLYSPGPFSGTASFDLPELPSTALVRRGRPLVGSETIDGDSWLTQRHELYVFTQRSGDITIPSFQVRFEGKQSFTSQPEPMQGMTPTLTFVSQRPPGTQAEQLVLSATALNARQTWTPDGDDVDLQAGDVMQRAVSLQADGTTAMMIPPVPAEAPEHVRLYDSEPEVQDSSGRGQSGSSRRETIRYQFEQPGTFQLPDIQLVWWDYQQEQLRSETLEGRMVTVTGQLPPAAESQAAADGPVDSGKVIFALVAILGAVVTFRPLQIAAKRLHQKWNSPEAVIRRRLIAACRANDARSAYAAVLAWNRITQMVPAGGLSSTAGEDSVVRKYLEECRVLAATLYSSGSQPSPWNGTKLQHAFTVLRRRHHQADRHHRTSLELGPLNPAGTSGI